MSIAVGAWATSGEASAMAGGSTSGRGRRHLWAVPDVDPAGRDQEHGLGVDEAYGRETDRLTGDLRGLALLEAEILSL